MVEKGKVGVDGFVVQPFAQLQGAKGLVVEQNISSDEVAGAVGDRVEAAWEVGGRRPSKVL